MRIYSYVTFYRLSRAFRYILLCVGLLHLGVGVIPLRHFPSILLMMNILQVTEKNIVSWVCSQ